VYAENHVNSTALKALAALISTGPARNAPRGKTHRASPMLGLPMLDKTSINHAQHLLAEYNHAKRPWIMSLEKSKRSEVPDGQVTAAAIVGEPLYLYLLMSTLDGRLIQLSTFTQCARCIVELGCWRHVYSTRDII